MARRVFWLLFALSLFFVLGGCLRSPERGDTQTARVTEIRKPETGDSASLARKDNKPLYNLEYIGAVVDPAGKQPVRVELGNELLVAGWAVDAPSRAMAGGVEIVIDGTPYTAAYGLPRGDVAEHFKVPAYSNAGFSFRTAATNFGAGRHQIAVRILTNDKRSYYEGLPVAVDIH